jgi:iron(III) transport system ATP-binding protein
VVVTGPGRHLPPEKRGTGLVFQHHALFPHLTVGRNVTFGLRSSSEKEKQQRLHELLDLVGLPGYQKRYPHELSGGERQRIALARALAPSPKLLLLDEPFSNLDPQWRLAIRDETRSILKKQGTTAILVTHHTQDALSVADRIAVLHRGILQQTAPPREIYHAPANAYVASLFGLCNFLPLRSLTHPGKATIRCHIGPPLDDGSRGTGLWVRPEDLELAPPHEDRAELLHGKVRQVSFQGDHHDVILDCETEGAPGFEIRVQHRGVQSIRVQDRWAIIPRPRT